MQFESQLPGAPVSPTRAVRPYGAAIAVTPRPQISEPVKEDRDIGEDRLRHADLQQEPWWRSLPAAMSWMTGQAIEGIAVFGRSMHPYLFEPPCEDAVVYHEPADALRNGDHRRPLSRREMPRMYEGLVTLEGADVSHARTAATVAPAWYKSIWSYLAGFWSSMRREQEKRWVAKRLEALDDRTLRDIGIPRCQIEYFVRDEGDCE